MRELDIVTIAKFYYQCHFSYYWPSCNLTSHDILDNQITAQNLGDSDALYGCGNGFLLEESGRISHLAQEGKLFKAMGGIDSALGRGRGGRGLPRELMSVLSRAGMYHFLGSYIGGGGRSDAASPDIQVCNRDIQLNFNRPFNQLCYQGLQTDRSCGLKIGTSPTFGTGSKTGPPNCSHF